MLCRSCYLESLSGDERNRAIAERPTGVIHLCPEHQAISDAFMATLDRQMFIALKE